MATYDGNKVSGFKVVTSSLKPLTATKTTQRILITRNAVINASKTTNGLVKNNYKFSVFSTKFTNGRYLSSLVLRQGSPVVKLAVVKNGVIRTVGLKPVDSNSGGSVVISPTTKTVGQIFPLGLNR